MHLLLVQSRYRAGPDGRLSEPDHRPGRSRPHGAARHGRHVLALQHGRPALDLALGRPGDLAARRLGVQRADKARRIALRLRKGRSLGPRNPHHTGQIRPLLLDVVGRRGNLRRTLRGLCRSRLAGRAVRIPRTDHQQRSRLPALLRHGALHRPVLPRRRRQTLPLLGQFPRALRRRAGNRRRPGHGRETRNDPTRRRRSLRRFVRLQARRLLLSVRLGGRLDRRHGRAPTAPS